MEEAMVAKMAEQKMRSIISALNEILEDTTVPRNVKEKIQAVIDSLENESAERSLRIDKALQIIDEITSDSNIMPYTRTQIWSIVSMLESQKG